MRVALDVTPLLGNRTGIGNFVDQVVRHLDERNDLEVVPFAVTWRGRRHAGAPTRPMPARPLRWLWQRIDWPPIESWTGDVDVVHGTNFVVPPSRRSIALVTVHDLTFARFPQMVTPDVRRYGTLVDRALRRGAHVHTPSQFVADEVVEVLGADPARVHVVLNGVAAAIDGDEARGRQLAGSDRYFLALGTVEPRKDLPLLVTAFDVVAAHDPDVRLVIAGPEGWGEDELGRAVAQARHRARIRRLGWVDDGARADLLAGARAFAYPSRYEGFGLPTLEAMSAGTPVVTTRAGALPEVVGEAAVLVDVGDRDGLATALRRLLDDDRWRDELAAQGRVRATRFGWDRSADQLATLYHELAESRR